MEIHLTPIRLQINYKKFHHKIYQGLTADKNGGRDVKTGSTNESQEDEAAKIRKLEVDLRRKSDLLAEVKVEKQWRERN